MRNYYHRQRSRWVYTPADSTCCWRALLSKPGKHWRTGRSAKAMAHSWQEAEGFPAEVQAVLEKEASFRGIKPLLVIHEHQVNLPPESGRPSHNDAWVLAKADSCLVSIAVEGKVDEPFGDIIEKWNPNKSKGKSARYDFLCKLLKISPSGNIRYQLLHRAASALIEAKEFTAKTAVMLVHSFGEKNQDNLTDYREFLSLFGVSGDANEIVYAGDRYGGIDLYFAWVKGDSKCLER